MSDFLHSSHQLPMGNRVTHSAPKLVSQCHRRVVRHRINAWSHSFKASPLHLTKLVHPAAAAAAASHRKSADVHPEKKTPQSNPTSVRSLVQQSRNQNLCVARFASHQSLKLKINCRHRLPFHPLQPQSIVSAASRAGTSGSLWARLTNVLV